jgi:RimJ/RimL family protein N-acetyltransferase
MLRGEVVGLRGRIESDVPVLHAEFYDDVAIRSQVSARPWVPIPSGPESPYAVGVRADDVVAFSVVELATGELAGAAIMTGLDQHNRSAHVGIALRAAFRGRGLSVDGLRVLTGYGFATRGLHRLQLETLADNAPMAAAALRVGYHPEGRAREAAWVNGAFVDEISFGLLATDWGAGPAA